MFKALKSKNFKLFFYGQSVSVIGTWLQKTAVSWMVYSVTGSVFLLLKQHGQIVKHLFAELIKKIMNIFNGSFLKQGYFHHSGWDAEFYRG